MKKNLFLTIVLSLLFCWEGFSANVIIDGAFVRGMFRGAVQTKTNLVTGIYTNALLYDMVLVNIPLRGYSSGIYQTFKTKPKSMTNWKLVAPTLSSNYIQGINNYAKYSQSALSSMTNIIHPIVVAEATNKARITAMAVDVLITNSLHPIIKTEGTNRNSLTRRVMTNSFFRFDQTNAFHLVMTTSATLRNHLTTTMVTNNFMSFGLTNSYHIGANRTGTNLSHSIFTNALSVKHTNAIMVLDNAGVRWRLVVTNGRVSAVSNTSWVK